jgi:hypothetical protein
LDKNTKMVYGKYFGGIGSEDGQSKVVLSE